MSDRPTGRKLPVSRPLQWVLGASVVATAVVALLPDDEAAPAVARAPAPPRLLPVVPAPVAVRWPSADVADAIDATAASDARADWPAVSSLALQAWGMPAPAPPTPPAAPPPSRLAELAAPQAPPFPYTLIGRIDDERGPQLLLSGPLKTIAARVADVIDGQWRVDAVESGSATVTWLPGALPQIVTYLPS